MHPVRLTHPFSSLRSPSFKRPPSKQVALLVIQVAAQMSWLLFLSGCATSDSGKRDSVQFTSPKEVRNAIASGPSQIEDLSRQISEIRGEFDSFRQEKAKSWRQRGYMNAQESDHVEALLFRFVSTQNALSDLVSALGGRHSDELFPEEEVKAAAHIMVVDAQFILIAQRAEMVAELKGDPVIVAKLNEGFPRSEIPAGAFSKLALEMTSNELPQRLQASWTLFEETLKQPEMVSLTRKNPAISKLAATVPSHYQRAKASLETLQGRVFATSLSHSRAAELMRQTEARWGNLRYKARSGLFKNVSRVKNPLIKVIEFSDSQIRELKSILQPGDIILTYTAGYMSDVFIPGSFKHGITYVGSPEQRLAAGLNATLLPDLAKTERLKISQAFRQAKLEDGKEADVIEAVAEGVIFNNLEHILTTHVNRIAVLRPRLSADERVTFLTEVFSYLGDPYDFLFDFADASRQVCTEVIYRGLDGKAGIDLPLKTRGGHPTLSADDIVNFHLNDEGRYFDVVAYAEQDANILGRDAIVMTGEKAKTRLRALMTMPRKSTQKEH